MKKLLSIKLVSLFLAFSMFFALAACGAGSGGTSSAASSTAGSEAATTAEAIDPLGKYDPGIEVTAWRQIPSTLKFEDGDTIDNNIWTKAYEEQLGVKINYTWTVPDSQFEQKLNIAVASGDLPDLMVVRNKQFHDLADNDSLYDLTELFDKYATPITKQYLTVEESNYKAGQAGGKLMAIPIPASPADGLPMIWYRTDWAEKLGLQAPRTMQDLIAMADAFTNNDPDGNNKADTYGLSINKELTDINCLMSGYHAYPRGWLLDTTGNVVYGSIQPEVKAGLLKFQEMYKAGLIDKEFGVKDAAKQFEELTASKYGILFGAMWNPLIPLNDNIKLNPKADWKPIALVSNDDRPAAPMTSIAINDYFVVNKDCKNPEVLIKLVNLFTKLTNEDMKYVVNSHQTVIEGYAFINIFNPRKNLDSHLAIKAALEGTKDTSELTLEQKKNYDECTAFEKGDMTKWATYKISGRSGSSFEIINKYITDKNVLFNVFYGAPTPTMSEKLASLNQLEIEVFTKIILGQSIDSFDKFVTDWKNLGGDQITKEVNEWYQKTK